MSRQIGSERRRSITHTAPEAAALLEAPAARRAASFPPASFGHHISRIPLYPPQAEERMEEADKPEMDASEDAAGGETLATTYGEAESEPATEDIDSNAAEGGDVQVQRSAEPSAARQIQPGSARLQRKGDEKPKNYNRPIPTKGRYPLNDPDTGDRSNRHAQFVDTNTDHTIKVSKDRNTGHRRYIDTVTGRERKPGEIHTTNLFKLRGNSGSIRIKDGMGGTQGRISEQDPNGQPAKVQKVMVNYGQWNMLPVEQDEISLLPGSARHKKMHKHVYVFAAHINPTERASGWVLLEAFQPGDRSNLGKMRDESPEKVDKATKKNSTEYSIDGGNPDVLVNCQIPLGASYVQGGKLIISSVMISFKVRYGDLKFRDDVSVDKNEEVGDYLERPKTNVVNLLRALPGGAGGVSSDSVPVNKSIHPRFSNLIFYRARSVPQQKITLYLPGNLLKATADAKSQVQLPPGVGLVSPEEFTGAINPPPGSPPPSHEKIINKDQFETMLKEYTYTLTVEEAKGQKSYRTMDFVYGFVDMAGGRRFGWIARGALG